MSLFSIMESQSASNLLTSSNSPLSSALQTLMGTNGADLAGAASSTLDGTATPAVSITATAKQTAAAQADAGKDAASLAAELRTTLDSQYDASGTKTADMSDFSARGLSLIALNDSGSFSRGEVDAAKAELRNRDRQSLLQNIATSGLSASVLKAYGSAQLTARLSMSAEELQLRNSDPSLS